MTCDCCEWKPIVIGGINPFLGDEVMNKSGDVFSVKVLFANVLWLERGFVYFRKINEPKRGRA